MAETSRPQVTITLGRTGQVVKRAGPVLDSSFSDSNPAVGSKRSVRDRLGSNLETTLLNNKRQREDSGLSTDVANGVDDIRLRKDDLRFKIMQKSVVQRTQSDGQQNGVDLREMLSRPARLSTTSLGMQRRIPEPRNGRQHIPESDYVRRHVPEVKDVRPRRPEPTSAILGPIPSTRSADALPQMNSFRNSFSPWTLDRLRRRSPDGVLHTSRGLSPPRNEDELRRRPLIRAYDDGRTVTYASKDIHEPSRPMGSASFITKPSLPAGLVKPVAPLLDPPPPSGGIVQKSLYPVDEQQTVEGFLRSLGLEKYFINFKVDMTALRQMGDTDLKELGIPMGPRKKILLALLSRSRRRV